MATEYNLGSYVGAAGTFQFYLYSDSASLTVPTTRTIRSLGSLVHRVDEVPGFTEIQNLSVTVTEKYDDHADGFWNNALEEDTCQLRILLDSIELFWGAIQKEETEWVERYVSGTDHTRTGTLVFVDLLYAMRDVVWSTFITAIETHDATYTYNGTPGRFIPLDGLFATMLETAYSQAYDTSDVVLNASDVRFRNENSGSMVTFALDTHYVMTQLGYFTTGGATSLEEIYDTPFDFLNAVVKSFGLIAWHEFDGSTHQLYLGARGRAPSAKFTPAGGLIESRLYVDNFVEPKTIRCLHDHNTQLVEAYVLPGFNAEVLTHTKFGATEVGEDPPTFASFDLNLNSPFTTYTDEMGNLYVQIYLGLSGGTIYRSDATQIYDYSISSYGTEYENHSQAMVTYFQRRLVSGRRLYQRTYGTIEDVQILDRHDIDDGLVSATFYATEIIKDLDNNTTQVSWVQE